MYKQPTNAIIIIYDISCICSFESVKKEVNNIRNNVIFTQTLFIVGNKIDLESQNNFDEGLELANSFGCVYTQISVKDSRNLKELFEIIANMCIEGLNKY